MSESSILHKLAAEARERVDQRKTLPLPRPRG